MKILIVEDFAPMRQIIMDVLKDSGMEFIECADGKDALAEYDRVQPEYVLMDIAMKQTDGITATKAIIDKYPDAKILMVTNYRDQSIMVASKEAGAVGYFLKDNLSELRKFFTS